MDFPTIAWNLLSDRDWLRISKPLLHRLGDRETIILCELISLDHFHRNKSNTKYDGWFKASNTLLFKHTAQRKDIQQRSITSLISQGLMEKRLSKGHIPATNEYMLNHEALVELICLGMPDLNGKSQQEQNTPPSRSKTLLLDDAKCGNYNKDLPKEFSKDSLNNNTPAACDMDEALPEPIPQPDGEDGILPHKEEVDYVAPRRTRTLPIPEPDPHPQNEHKPDPIKSAGSRLMRDSAPGAKDGFLSLQTLAYQVHVSKDQFFRYALPIGQLNILDQVEESRIRALIAWWHDHHNDPFAPNCFSGFDLRKNFSRLEQFMLKSKNGGNGNGKKPLPNDLMSYHRDRNRLNKKPIYQG